MKNLFLLLGALIFAFCSCTKDPMPDPSGANSQDLKKAGVITFTLKGVNMQNHPTANPMVYTISGNMSHLGLINPASTLTITGMWPDWDNPATGPNGQPTNFRQTCEINMIADDGSIIHYVTDKPGTFSFATGYGETSWIIDSGTGRFEGATGWYNSTSQFDFATGINYVMGTGEIYITKK